MDTLNRRRGRRTQCGAAAVEFALLLPIVMGVLAGITDFGRYFFLKVELTNAAREGARAAVVGEDAALRAAAAVRGPSAPLPDGFATSIDGCSGPAPDRAVVTASANFDWMFLGPMMGVLVGPDAALPPAESTAEMLCN